MARAFLHYDVFTRDRLRGNQLAVFLDGRGLDPSLMQQIAREMNFSESTFVLPPERDDTDVRMRIFTPGSELPIAGHPTIGSTFALAEAGVIAHGADRFVFGLNIGPVPVDLRWSDGRLQFAWMTQPNPAFGGLITGERDRAAVAAAIGVDAAGLADLPIQEVSCGLPYLMIPLRDPSTVDRAAPADRMPHIIESVAGRVLPAFVFSIVSDGAVYSRMFAPAIGILEDPATGSASGPLGCYLVRHGLVSPARASSIVSDQGVAMGRASRIHVAISGGADAITDVKVGGEAVLVGRGELLI